MSEFQEGTAMTFASLGFYYLEPGQSIDINLYFGASGGDDIGALFSMARFPGQDSGQYWLGDGSYPRWEFETSNFRRSVQYGFWEIGAGDIGEGTDPAHTYTVTVSNTGQSPGHLTLDGMSSS
jgi:hypothetical protein